MRKPTHPVTEFEYNAIKYVTITEKHIPRSQLAKMFNRHRETIRRISLAKTFKEFQQLNKERNNTKNGPKAYNNLSDYLEYLEARLDNLESTLLLRLKEIENLMRVL